MSEKHMENDQDRIVIDRLLSELGRRLDGAVDFWTVICLEGAVPERDAFLQKNCDILRSLVEVSRIVIGARNGRNGTGEMLDRIALDCQRLRSIFSVLSKFQQESLDHLRSASEDLDANYTRLSESFRQLGRMLDVPISYYNTRTPEAEQHCRSILDRLFDVFAQARSESEIISSR